MKKWIKIMMVLILVLILAGVGINVWVVKSTKKDIVASIQGEEIRFVADKNDVKQFKADCLIVPGAGVKPDGKPSKMLADRLDLAIRLYQMGIAPKILLSGDNGQMEYNELAAMQKYVLDRGVPKEDIFLDHAGFSTYETMYRAKEVFLVKRGIVVTQSYHLHRALYVGKMLDMEVRGAASDQKRYTGQGMRDVREILAREKDFFKSVFKPKPTYLGEPFPIWGDGTKTWV
ncbi:MAG: SanA/YdcF family protein [Anaerovoracaceae bacterium]|jgi:SanA protein